jgi:hypothetical protein
VIRPFPTAFAIVLVSATFLTAQEPAVSSLASVEEPAIERASVQDIDPPRWLACAEYLYWWIRSDHVPGALITLGSPGDRRPGAHGMPGTVALPGSTMLEYAGNSGGRLTLASWRDAARTIGVEAAGFMLETHTIHLERNSDRAGNPLIARPFFNTLSGRESAFVITSPGAYRGGIDVFADSRLWGAEANLVGNLARDELLEIDLLAGFRYLGLKDELRFDQSSTLLGPSARGFLGRRVVAPDILSVRDFFETHDQFFGGQVGLRGGFRWGRWQTDGLVKVGLGSTWQEVAITGRTLRTGPDGRSELAPGGLYALPSNGGYQERCRVSFIAETELRLRYRILDGLSAHVGYNFLWWDDVARPGGQLNRAVDPRQVPGSLLYGKPGLPTQPIRAFHATDFWAQGLTLGLALRF